MCGDLDKPSIANRSNWQPMSGRLPTLMGAKIENNVPTLRLVDKVASTATGGTANSPKPMPHWFAAEARGTDGRRGCKRSFLHAEMMCGKNPIIDPTDTSVIPFSGVRFNVDAASDPF